MMKYTVTIKDHYAKEGVEPVELTFYTLDDVMKFVELAIYGQREYQKIDITVQGCKIKEDEE